MTLNKKIINTEKITSPNNKDNYSSISDIITPYDTIRGLLCTCLFGNVVKVQPQNLNIISAIGITSTICILTWINFTKKSQNLKTTNLQQQIKTINKIPTKQPLLSPKEYQLFITK